MESAIKTLREGLKYCKKWTRENPNCSEANKKVKQTQIREHEQAIKILSKLKIT